MELYNQYSTFLKNKYGEKVYRIPISLPLTCPNRDGTVGVGGCTFCADIGVKYEAPDEKLPVKEQLSKNIEYMGKKYNCHKFIAYFQNYTNTYMPFEDFKRIIIDTVRSDVVETAVSTRPDCVSDRQLNFLSEFNQTYKITPHLELGLQTVNYRTLKKINRGHTLAEFIDCVNRAKKHDIFITVHMILDLPSDDDEDAIEGAKILSALKIDGVKLHSLYIAKGSKMAEEYENGTLKLLDLETYIRRTALFLSYLNPEITIERIVGRAPERSVLICNYHTSHWKVKDKIIEYMQKNNLKQGCFIK